MYLCLPDFNPVRPCKERNGNQYCRASEGTHGVKTMDTLYDRRVLDTIDETERPIVDSQVGMVDAWNEKINARDDCERSYGGCDIKKSFFHV
jgi:hypothetical protein